MEYDYEPVRGLPERLPEGERILWQGAPDWRRLARTAFHARSTAIYFGLLIVLGLLTGSYLGALVTVGAAAGCLALLCGLSALAARTTVYTITNRRVVLRFGMALPKCVNLPMKAIADAGLRLHSDGTGDITLALIGEHKLGYLRLWPHARPWRLRAPEPMMRAVPDARDIAALLGRAMGDEVPNGRRIVIDDDDALSGPVYAPGRSVPA